MRVTTQMLNVSSRKAGLPINRTSLLNYIRSDGKNNTMLDALNQKRAAGTETENKKKYEKLRKTADQLVTSSNALLQDGEKSLFEQAKKSGDKHKIYEGIETFFEGYNSNMKALNNASGTMNDFYRQMLSEAKKEAKEALGGIGISFAKDGTANIDADKLKSADIESLEKLFGSKSEMVSKVKCIASRISNNAEASIKSYSNAYSSKGNIFSGSFNSRYDFKG